MVKLITYQDLQRYTARSTDKSAFVRSVILDHQGQERFKIGQKAGLFYRHHDPELEKIRKWFYDREGNAYEDTETANHKIAANWFYLLTTQTVSYLLGNGITFDDPKIKETLSGDGDIDYDVQQILAYACCDGEAYGYVGEKRITPLCYACRTEGNEPVFAPLYDEMTGEIKAGVRYWRLTPDTPMQATLFEQEGYTEYAENDKKILETVSEQKSYNNKSISSKAEGTYKQEKSNKFPIVRMRYINNQSSIEGNEGLIFAYDLMMSGMVNKSDMNLIYWIIDNADGMSRQDDINFVADLYKTHIAHMRDGINLRKEEITANINGYQSVLEELKRLIFLNFQGIDIDRISAGAVTATEIRASYTNIDLKCDKVEKYVSEFIKDVLSVKGLDRNAIFHYSRNKIVNEAEEVQTAIQLAPLIGTKAARRYALTAKGKIDEIEQIESEIMEEAMTQFSGEPQGNTKKEGKEPKEEPKEEPTEEQNK